MVVIKGMNKATDKMAEDLRPNIQPARPIEVKTFDTEKDLEDLQNGGVFHLDAKELSEHDNIILIMRGGDIEEGRGVGVRGVTKV